MLIRFATVALLIMLSACAHQSKAPAPESARAEAIHAADEAFGRQQYDAAAHHYSRAVSSGADTPLVHFRYGYALHVSGHPMEALPHHIAATHIDNPALRIDALYNAACANALLGNREAALGYFSRAVHAGFKDLAQLERDHDLDSIREEPEFKRLAGAITGAA